MDQKELDEIVRLHGMWINSEFDSKRGKIANLRGADLCGADLRGADLRGADLCAADLCAADLCAADLCAADLRDADLRGADLCAADLCAADLCAADLCAADLCTADLRDADLRGADLRDADLRGADLRGADLRDADLRGADLRGADLSGVIYNSNTLFFALSCPEKGAFTAFKRCGDFIVELLVPADARRCSATSRKCRCDKALVVAITNIDGSPSECDYTVSKYDGEFIYKVGEIAEVKDFNADRWVDCAPGIHFFITRNEAVNYII